MDVWRNIGITLIVLAWALAACSDEAADFRSGATQPKNQDAAAKQPSGPVYDGRAEDLGSRVPPPEPPPADEPVAPPAVPSENDTDVGDDESLTTMPPDSRAPREDDGVGGVSTVPDVDETSDPPPVDLAQLGGADDASPVGAGDLGGDSASSSSSTAVGGADDGEHFDPRIGSHNARSVIRKTVVKRSFAVSERRSNTLTVSPSLDEAHLDVVLDHERRPQTQLIQQVNRAEQRLERTQGLAVTDEFVQPGISGPLDILVVVDTSGSMKEEQTNLSTKLSALLNFVGDAQWQIGIATMDAADPCVTRVITKEDANTDALFRSTVAGLGTGGSGKEQGFLRLVSGLQPSCHAGWVRDDSVVAVLLVSDEENATSSGGDEPDATSPSARPEFARDFLAGMRQIGVDARVYGILSGDPKCSTAHNASTDYIRLVEQTSGTWGSICAADYSATLSAISQDVAGLLTTHELQHAPDPGSLALQIDGEDRTTGFSVNGKTLMLEEAPPIGAQIQATYTSGWFATIDLETAPAPGTLEVTVNGGALPDSQFTVSTQPARVSFAPAPPAEATVEVAYRVDEPLDSEWTLPRDLDPGAIEVLVDGVLSESFGYDPPSGRLTVTPTPSDGAQMRVDFEVLGDPITRIPFEAPDRDIVSLSAEDKLTGDPVGVTLEQDALVLQSLDDFEAGRELAITYRVVGVEQAFQLPHAPLAGSLKVTTARDADVCGPEDLALEGRQLRLGCTPDAAEPLSITYSYRTPLANQFTLEGIAYPDNKLWIVQRGDGSALDYTRDGLVVSVPEDQLQPDDVVHIEVIEEIPEFQ